MTAEGNLTKVLQERADQLKNSKEKFTTCGKDLPYYDGISCISCPHEFDLSTKKCVEAPKGKAYNHNVHAYLTPEANKITRPNSLNLLEPKLVGSTSVGTGATATTTGASVSASANGSAA